jgi:hypothetical protein
MQASWLAHSSQHSQVSNFDLLAFLMPIVRRDPRLVQQPGQHVGALRVVHQEIQDAPRLQQEQSVAVSKAQARRSKGCPV